MRSENVAAAATLEAGEAARPRECPVAPCPGCVDRAGEIVVTLTARDGARTLGTRQAVDGDDADRDDLVVCAPRRQAGSGRLAFDVRRIDGPRAAGDAQHLLVLHAAVGPDHPQEHIARVRRRGAHAGEDNEPGACLGIPGNVRRQVGTGAWARCSEHELRTGWSPLGIEHASYERERLLPVAAQLSARPHRERSGRAVTRLHVRGACAWNGRPSEVERIVGELCDAAEDAATKSRATAIAGTIARRRPREISSIRVPPPFDRQSSKRAQHSPRHRRQQGGRARRCSSTSDTERRSRASSRRRRRARRRR